jgi:elongation factor Tu
MVDAFSDFVDDGKPIDVVADIRFLSTNEGGKSCAVRAHYRPNHNFGSPDNRAFYIGQVEVAAGDEIAPGESRRVPIRFLSGRGLRELLFQGREWRVQEGSKLVAIARLVEVHDAI